MSDKTSKPQGRYAAMQGTGQAMSGAFEFAGAVFMFWLVGKGVEALWDIEPWGQVVGGVIGWVGGTAHLFYGAYGKEHADKKQRAEGTLTK